MTMRLSQRIHAAIGWFGAEQVALCMTSPKPLLAFVVWGVASKAEKSAVRSPTGQQDAQAGAVLPLLQRSVRNARRRRLRDLCARFGCDLECWQQGGIFVCFRACAHKARMLTAHDAARKLAALLNVTCEINASCAGPIATRHQYPALEPKPKRA